MNTLSYFLDHYQPVPEGHEYTSVSCKGWYFISCFASFQDPKIFHYLNLGFLKHCVTFTAAGLCWKLSISWTQCASTYPAVREQRFMVIRIWLKVLASGWGVSFYPAVNHTLLFCSRDTSDFSASYCNYWLQLMSSVYVFLLNIIWVERM